MPTKLKTSEGKGEGKELSLEPMLAQALEQFNGGNLLEAAAAFESLQEEAGRQEAFRLGRTAQGYLKAVRSRLDSQSASTPQLAELAVQIELNRHAPTAALALAEEGVKAHPDHCGLHYLMAVALAQLDQAPASAEALAKATALEPGLIYQFRLEADFDGIRHSAPFAAFNRG